MQAGHGEVAAKIRIAKKVEAARLAAGVLSDGTWLPAPLAPALRPEDEPAPLDPADSGTPTAEAA
jgi:hypothetical protein